MMIIPLILIGILVWILVSPTSRDRIRSGLGEKRSPMDIAKERYARGEITKEQFEQIKRDLGV